LETFKQILGQYIPEIEQGYEHPSLCENILASMYEILEMNIRANYRFSKKVYEYSGNEIIKLTKRLLFGPHPDDDMPSQMM
jgi:hypothetical protein